MAFEYTMLLVMTLFFMLAWLPASIGKYLYYGPKWLASNRESTPQKETPAWFGRVERAYSNLKDYFPAFVVAVLVLGFTGQFDEVTTWASGLYVVGRIAHFASYGFGSTYGRFFSYVLAMGCNLVLLIKAF